MTTTKKTTKTLPVHYGKNAPKVECFDTGLKYDGHNIWESVEDGKWYERHHSSYRFGKATWIFAELNKEFVESQLGRKATDEAREETWQEVNARRAAIDKRMDELEQQDLEYSEEYEQLIVEAKKAFEDWREARSRELAR